MNKKIILWSITAALAGFLFGFDVVVISGADKKLQLLWGSSDSFHGWIVMGGALWGTVLGAIFGGIPTNKYGRKSTLIVIGVLFAISAIGSALVNDSWVFAVFRFIGGIGVGASTIAAPAYISEIAPAKDRGRLVAMYQFNIVFGIMIAYLSNYLLSGIGDDDWRWMVGVEAIPAVLYILFALKLPKSPRWLYTQSRTAEAKEVLQLINPEIPIEEQLAEFESHSVKADKTENILMGKYRFPLTLAFLIAFFNQFSGINAFLYYAPRIFEEAGLGESTALLSSVGIGVTNLVFTLLGVFLIDRLGRKTLMYIGSVGYIISLGLVSAAFFLGWSGMAVPIFLFLFIAAHAIGQGAVIWVFISEIFPNHLRASGQAFGSSTHWVLAALIPSSIPFLFNHPMIGAGVVFLVFAGMMVLQLLFVAFMMPETKGKTLEELEDIILKKNKMQYDKLKYILLFLLMTSIAFASKVDTLIVFSESMQKDIKNVIITPDSYQKKGESYSVVYLLHGAGGDHRAWLGKAPNIKKYADLYNVIIVCPDGEKTSWYFDSPIDDTYQYETYMSKELVSAIDTEYSTKADPAHRAITGYSMGGHGALYLAFKHTDIWGIAASMSGGVDIRPYPRSWDISDRLGSYAENKDNWEQNSVINLVHKLNGKNLKFLFDCGYDDFFYPDNKRLHEKLVERNIPHDYIERPGKHDNKYWSNSITYQMLFFKERFNETP